MDAYLKHCSNPQVNCAHHDKVNASNSRYFYIDTEKSLRLKQVTKGKSWTKEELNFKDCHTEADCRAKARVMVSYDQHCRDLVTIGRRSAFCDPNDRITADTSRSRYVAKANAFRDSKTEGPACKKLRLAEQKLRECREDRECNPEAKSGLKDMTDAMYVGDVNRARKECDNEKSGRRSNVVLRAGLEAILNPRATSTSSKRKVNSEQMKGQR